MGPRCPLSREHVAPSISASAHRTVCLGHPSSPSIPTGSRLGSQIFFSMKPFLTPSSGLPQNSAPASPVESTALTLVLALCPRRPSPCGPRHRVCGLLILCQHGLTSSGVYTVLHRRVNSQNISLHVLLEMIKGCDCKIMNVIQQSTDKVTLVLFFVYLLGDSVLFNL